MNLFAGKKAAFHTLGCKVNVYETDAMKAMLEDAGFCIVPFEPGADLYVINTCSVTNIADRKSRQVIHRARKMNPGALLVVCGCYVETAADQKGLSADADLILGNNHKSELLSELQKFYEAVEAERQAGVRKSDLMHESSFEQMTLPRISDHTRAYIKVQDGCNMFCSYCIIPYARGRIRSRKMEDILPELRGLAAQGVRELVLTGIHLSSYGVDLAGEDDDLSGSGRWQDRSRLIDLIEAVNEIDGIERIRLGSLEPSIVSDEFAERLSKVGKFCPHFHLSLQSGSDSVLRRMNRHYTTEEYRSCVERLRAVFDRPAITTDVITGFPGETEEEFQQTVDFLKEIRLFETHIFRYSMRAGTRAARMKDQVSEQLKAERSDILLKLNAENKLAYERSWDGREAEVLVEEEALRDADGNLALPNVEKLAARGRGKVSESVENSGRNEKESSEKLYTGYTRQYIRTFISSKEDIRGRILKGKLQVDKLIFLY